MDEILQILDHYKLFSLAILAVLLYIAIKGSSKATKFFAVITGHNTEIALIQDNIKQHLDHDEKFHTELFDRMNKTEIEVARIKGKIFNGNGQNLQG
jgi:apolipoprotein N-acyltransferase